MFKMMLLGAIAVAPLSYLFYEYTEMVGYATMTILVLMGLNFIGQGFVRLWPDAKTAHKSRSL
jgi:putative Mn2+ efflux pump MntP